MKRRKIPVYSEKLLIPDGPLQEYLKSAAWSGVDKEPSHGFLWVTPLSVSEVRGQRGAPGASTLLGRTSADSTTIEVQMHSTIEDRTEFEAKLKGVKPGGERWLLYLDLKPLYFVTNFEKQVTPSVVNFHANFSTEMKTDVVEPMIDIYAGAKIVKYGDIANGSFGDVLLRVCGHGANPNKTKTTVCVSSKRGVHIRHYNAAVADLPKGSIFLAHGLKRSADNSEVPIEYAGITDLTLLLGADSLPVSVSKELFAQALAWELADTELDRLLSLKLDVTVGHADDSIPLVGSLTNFPGGSQMTTLWPVGVLEQFRDGKDVLLHCVETASITGVPVDSGEWEQSKLVCKQHNRQSVKENGTMCPISGCKVDLKFPVAPAAVAGDPLVRMSVPLGTYLLVVPQMQLKVGMQFKPQYVNVTPSVMAAYLGMDVDALEQVFLRKRYTLAIREALLREVRAGARRGRGETARPEQNYKFTVKVSFVPDNAEYPYKRIVQSLQKTDKFLTLTNENSALKPLK